MIKRIHGGLIAIGHTRFKLSDGVRRAFRVGVIGRKYKYFRPYVLNNPADGLAFLISAIIEILFLCFSLLFLF